MKRNIHVGRFVLGMAAAVGLTAVAQQTGPPMPSMFRLGPFAVTEDGGKTWRDLPLPHAGHKVLKVVVGTSGDAPIALSSDGAISRFADGFWSDITFVPEPSLDSFKGAFAADSEDPSTLWYGGTGMWRYSPDTHQWEAIITPLKDAHFTAVLVSPLDSAVVIGADDHGNFYRMVNALDSASEVKTEVNTVYPARIDSLAFHPDNDKRVRAIFPNPGGVDSLGLVWESVDGGKTWNALNSPFETPDEDALADRQDGTAISPLATSTSTSCKPTLSRTAISIGRAGAASKVVQISFPKGASPNVCQWFAGEDTTGMITIRVKNRDIGPHGLGEVIFDVLPNRTGKPHTGHIKFQVRTGNAGSFQYFPVTTVTQSR